MPQLFQWHQHMPEKHFINSEAFGSGYMDTDSVSTLPSEINRDGVFFYFHLPIT